MRARGFKAVWRLPAWASVGPDQFTAINNATLAALVGSAINATLILAAYWGALPSWKLLSWYVLSLSIFAYGLLTPRRRRDRKPTAIGARQMRRAAFNAMLIGMPWGVLALMCMGVQSHIAELILVATAAAMAASGSVYLAPVYPAAIAYMLAVLLPTALSCFVMLQAGYALLGALTLSYAAFLWAVIASNARLSIGRSEANNLLQERTTVLQAIIDNFPGGIGFFDRHLRVVVCNDRAKKLLDLPPELFEHGPPLIDDLIRFNGARGEFGPESTTQVDAKIALMHSRQPYHFERERPDGTFLDVRGMPIDNGGFVTTYMDITERMRSEKRITYMVRHDALTGLANRLVFRERLQMALARRRLADEECVVLVLLDVDRFKEINDTLGHPIGDRLLVAMADRLKACVREGDLLTRFGGDEFGIVFSARDPGREASALARRVLSMLNAPVDLDGHVVATSVSIGIAVSPQDGELPDDLVKAADMALHRAKTAGRDTYRFFEPSMDAELRRRRELEQGLKHALERNELAVHYQPIENLAAGAITGFEALLRWTREDGTSVPPSEFIPIAEETGAIIAIGEWVLRRACEQAVQWPPHIKIAVNMSPAQFKSSSVVTAVAEALRRSGLAPERLEVEVTESIMMRDADGAYSTLKELRALGVRLALDDFGTGYSSFSNLRVFAFDKIKVDRSFVGDLEGGSAHAIALIRSMAELGRSLNMSTTAEGVETSAQRELLMAEGFTEIQGYFLAKPAPAADHAHLLAGAGPGRAAAA